MKAPIAVGIASSLTMATFGQGLIQFNNRALNATPNPVNSPIYRLDFEGHNPLDGANTLFRAALLGGPTDAIPAHVNASRTNANDTDNSYRQGTLSMLASPSSGATWVTFREGLFAGYVAVGTDGARDSGLPYGSIGQFQVVAWGGPYTTWAQAYAAWEANPAHTYIGASNPMFLPTTPNASDQNLPTLQGLESFSIKWTFPEPDSLSLVGLGFGLWCLGAHVHPKLKPPNPN
jgi:hypothetical protein